MAKTVTVLFLVVILPLPSLSFGWSLFEPKNYEECIIDGMKGVSSDVAAREIRKVCTKKFKYIHRDLRPEEISNLKVTWKRRFWTGTNFEERYSTKPWRCPEKDDHLNLYQNPDPDDEALQRELRVGWIQSCRCSSWYVYIHNANRDLVIDSLEIRIGTSDGRFEWIHVEDFSYFSLEKNKTINKRLEPNEVKRIIPESNNEFRNWCTAEKPAAESFLMHWKIVGGIGYEK